jgi:hypothetical protein
MKYIKGVFMVLSVIVVLVTASALVLNKLEVTEVSFNSYADIAAINGIFSAGWIPAWLPKSARGIKEVHDIDSNAGWLIFSFDKGDQFYLKCTSIRREEIYLPEENRVGRFPAFVKGAHNQLKSNANLLFYRCNDERDRFLALDEKEGLAYVWRAAD